MPKEKLDFWQELKLQNKNLKTLCNMHKNEIERLKKKIEKLIDAAFKSGYDPDYYEDKIFDYED